MKVEVLSVFLVCVLASTTPEAQETLYLIPSPKQITYNEGVFELKGEIAVTLYFNDKEEEAFQFALLEEEAKRSTEVVLSLGEGTEKRIIVGIDGGGRAFTRLARQHDMLPDETLGEEGYRLLVSPNLVLVSANTTRGAFYGVQTLRQLFRTQRVVGSVPSLKIKDWPDLEIRGMMDDISRGPVPTKEYMRQQIERMAGMKINLLTYYTQDVVKTESHPSFAPPGGALDIEEWAELADYAKKFHIDLVGNFQSFGHFQNILKHPEYAHLGESGSLLSPAFEESYQLLSDIYHEMIPAFHSEYFHINSDETFDLGTGASKAMVDSLGKGVVYANHIKRIYDIITPMGKKIMMWGDIVLKHPEILELLPKDIIMVTWGYDDMDDYSHMINPFKEAGYSTLVSTGILNSWSVMPDFNVAKGNIEGFVAEAKKQEVLGMLNTIWDDGGFALFSKDWYGVAYAADQSWTSNPGDKTYDARFNRVVYGGTNNGFSNTIQTLNELSFLKSTEKMNEDVL
ncbi:MAG: beta-N-acetylhexosaminidase, partial [Balneolales bacterium]|nr:beta-N-acetylhexosaminidase [Balneolales bacterium]